MGSHNAFVETPPDTVSDFVRATSNGDEKLILNINKVFGILDCVDVSFVDATFRRSGPNTPRAGTP